MNVLIIGGSGLVGGNILKGFLKGNKIGMNLGTHLNYPTPETIFLDPMKEPYSTHIINKKWDVIIHTGALTNVDKCEVEQELSYQLTVISTQRLLALAKANNAKFIFISTDYVFDGYKGPYREADEVGPLNLYGKHKLNAEQIVQAYQDHLIIRITNVYGEEIRNKNFVSRTVCMVKTNVGKLEIKAPLDQYATPVNAMDVAKAILLLAKDDKRGIYHIASTDYMSRVQLLQRINMYFSEKIHIKALMTSELKQSAQRPLRGGLIAEKFLSEYPHFIFTNIDDFLKLNKND